VLRTKRRGSRYRSEAIKVLALNDIPRAIERLCAG
jgi:hypothetical protein